MLAFLKQLQKISGSVDCKTMRERKKVNSKSLECNTNLHGL